MERLVVGLPLAGAAVDLLRPAVVAGVRVDGHHGDAVGGGPRQHDRRAPAVGADLHHRGRGLERRGTLPEHARLGVGHPALDAGDRRQSPGEAATGVHILPGVRVRIGHVPC